jgi:hypothetical protein
MACSHQPINQPVPVVSRFDDHAKQLFLIRTQRGTYRREIVRQPLGIHDLVVVVRDDDKAVVGMKINATK